MAARAPLTNAKILRAVAVARRAAVPLAVNAAGVQATRVAIAAGLQPGAILSGEELGSSPFGGYYFGPPTRRFGPNRSWRTGAARAASPEDERPPRARHLMADGHAVLQAPRRRRVSVGDLRRLTGATYARNPAEVRS